MMKIISGVRASGKTTKLIQESARTGCPILVVHSSNIKEIEYMAHDMNLDIPSPLLFQDVLDGKLRGKKLDGVLVDNLDWILETYLNVHILAVTVSEPIKHEKLLVFNWRANE